MRWVYAKLLMKNGFPQNQAEGLVAPLTTMEIRNIYDKNVIEEQRVNLRYTIEEQRQESEKRLNEQRREFDKRMELAERQIEREIAESRSRHRWLIGTIVSVGAAIIGYLSAILHKIGH